MLVEKEAGIMKVGYIRVSSKYKISARYRSYPVIEGNIVTGCPSS
jgi:hypothetical protein